jgi:hypothetical protein
MTNDTHPYAYEVIPSANVAGHFDWIITRHGKLAERSDRPHRSEAEARKSAEKAIERQFTDARSMR